MIGTRHIKFASESLTHPMFISLRHLSESMADVKANEKDLARLKFIKERFTRYYTETKVNPPSRLENREFGVITERAGM